MSSLIALPVRGESFLLAKETKTILVDGGYSARKLFDALKKSGREIANIDVVVCTHADIDHAGGLKGFIDETGIAVGEFWLPGKWLDCLEELILSPNKVMNGLISDLDNGLEEPTNQIGWSEMSQETDETAANIWLSTLLFETSKDWVRLEEVAIRAFNAAKEKIRYRRNKGNIEENLAGFYLSLVDAADAIRAIVLQAVKHQVKIRWFDFGRFLNTRHAQGGYKDLLEPLNSVEYVRLPQKQLSYFAKLTQRNVECLSFFAPSQGCELGVVFCGDSPMGVGLNYQDSFLDSSNRPDWPVVATAPHHGSDSNAIAYDHMAKWAKVLCWVRAGGKKSHPGDRFSGLPASERVCTHCPKRGEAPIRVEVDLGGCLTLPCILPIRLLTARACDCRSI